MEAPRLGRAIERNKTRAGLKREANFGTNFWNPGKTVSYGQLEKAVAGCSLPTRMDLSGGRRRWPRNGHSGPSANVNCFSFVPVGHAPKPLVPFKVPFYEGAIRAAILFHL
jgi:hypothetical protein